MKILSVFLAALLCLTACTDQRKRPAFDGQFFRASAKKDGDDRADFIASVRPVSASLAGALEAGRFEGTRYCIENYGTSDILWEIGPDQDPETVVVDGDGLVLKGRCNE